jgi:hypothetical protein
MRLSTKIVPSGQAILYLSSLLSTSFSLYRDAVKCELQFVLSLPSTTLRATMVAPNGTGMPLTSLKSPGIISVVTPPSLRITRYLTMA